MSIFETYMKIHDLATGGLPVVGSPAMWLPTEPAESSEWAPWAGEPQILVSHMTVHGSSGKPSGKASSGIADAVWVKLMAMTEPTYVREDGPMDVAGAHPVFHTPPMLLMKFSRDANGDFSKCAVFDPSSPDFDVTAIYGEGKDCAIAPSGWTFRPEDFSPADCMNIVCLASRHLLDNGDWTLAPAFRTAAWNAFHRLSVEASQAIGVPWREGWRFRPELFCASKSAYDKEVSALGDEHLVPATGWPDGVAFTNGAAVVMENGEPTNVFLLEAGQVFHDLWPDGDGCSVRIDDPPTAEFFGMSPGRESPADGIEIDGGTEYVLVRDDHGDEHWIDTSRKGVVIGGFKRL